MRCWPWLLLVGCQKDPEDTVGAGETGVTTPEPQPTESEPGPVGVSVRRTTHGVLHVTASDGYGLGYGVGYAYTEDNRCLLQWRLAEVTGTLASQIGADGDVLLAVHGITYPALDSDRFWRGWLNDEAIEAGFLAGSEEVRAMAEGYAAGINRFLDDHPELPPCEVNLAGPVTAQQVYRAWVGTAEVASGEVLAAYLADRSPASARSARSLPAWPTGRPFGSNAWAIGADGVTEGSAVHLYNPHFPWEGIHRVFMVHLTIPGDLDVMGAALGGMPVPVVGFNQDVAWGLTFSSAARFTVAELSLVPGDPLRYTVGDATRLITEEVLSIDVAGEEAPREVSFFRAEDGPILDAAAYLMGWTTNTAFAVHDVNADNTRFVEQMLGLARAASVHDVQASLAAIQGVPWSYTVAADSSGEVFFGDVSNVPAVSSDMVSRCSTPTSAFLRPFGIFVLDGADPDCGWAGRMAAEDQPWVIRSDYVANSNNTHDLPNVASPLLGYSSIFGAEGGALALRPAGGLVSLHRRLDGTDGLGAPGFTGPLARQVFALETNHAARIVSDVIVDECQSNPTGTWDGVEVDLTAACAALAGWDHGHRVESVGALVFATMWEALEDSGSATAVFAVPASWEDPLGTPAGLTKDPAVLEDVRAALARATLTLAEHGLSPESPWGAGNVVVGPSGPLGMPGGSGAQGLFDVIENGQAYGTWAGWVDTLSGVPANKLFGASYLHVVSLGPSGPSAEGVLAYSQATEPTSPWYHDQLADWSAGVWMEFPFTEAEISADPELTALEL